MSMGLHQKDTDKIWDCLLKGKIDEFKVVAARLSRKNLSKPTLEVDISTRQQLNILHFLVLAGIRPMVDDRFKTQEHTTFFRMMRRPEGQSLRNKLIDDVVSLDLSLLSTMDPMFKQNALAQAIGWEQWETALHLINVIKKNSSYAKELDKESKDLAYGNTPLVLASELIVKNIQLKSVVLALLDAGADPNKANRHGQTALHMAMLLHDEKLCSTLKSKGADLYAKTDVQTLVDESHDYPNNRTPKDYYNLSFEDLKREMSIKTGEGGEQDGNAVENQEWRDFAVAFSGVGAAQINKIRGINHFLATRSYVQHEPKEREDIKKEQGSSFEILGKIKQDVVNLTKNIKSTIELASTASQDGSKEVQSELEKLDKALKELNYQSPEVAMAELDKITIKFQDIKKKLSPPSSSN